MVTSTGPLAVAQLPAVMAERAGSHDRFTPGLHHARPGRAGRESMADHGLVTSFARSDRFTAVKRLQGVEVVAGETKASDVGELFTVHYLGLVRLAVRLVDDQQTAEDVVQDVFAAFARRHSRDVAEPLAYLRRAVINEARSVVRRRRVARAFWSHSAPVAVVGPADGGVLHGEERGRMLHAIRSLSQRQREVIVLRFYEDLTVAEIGIVLGVSAGAVSSALNRALATLATRMEKS